MIDLNRILLATDFSDCAAKAKRMAQDLSVRFGAELHILHVIHDLAVEVPEFGMGLSFPSFVENIGGKRKELQKNATKLLEKEINGDRDEELNVVLATKFGAPFVEVIRYAREHDVDLIVVGSHGRTGLNHVLLGSVAEKIVRKAPCPVLTVRQMPDEPPAEGEHVYRPGIHPLPVG